MVLAEFFVFFRDRCLNVFGDGILEGLLSLKAPWPGWGPCWVHVTCFGFFFRNTVASKAVLFSTESVKHSQNTAATPRRD